jgi:hypothetical protein
MSANDDRLQRIQALQFEDRPAAERLLLDFVREVFPGLDARTVELRPLAVSLNSFNGFLTTRDGRRLFFKTHVEPGSIIGEYYNSALLAEAGYPVIRPVYASTEYGRQFLIYDVIDAPSVFDVAHAIERGERHDLDALAEAQARADDLLLHIYWQTLASQSADEAARAPVHQLFHHRLGARYAQFYAGKAFVLPGGASLAWETLCERTWIINGVPATRPLGEAIAGAREALRPDQAGWSVVGHGDAHNGNVFFAPETPGGLVYFDPAFGGRHHPMLDLAKPLFHNVFATWMYHPHEVDAVLHLTWRDDGRTITVDHDYRPSACRRMFLESKRHRVLEPILRETALITPTTSTTPTADAGAWRVMLDAAILCCPLLTMNLADRSRFPATIGLLGLCFAASADQLLDITLTN